MVVDERVYWVWMAETLGQGSTAAAELIRRYGNARTVYEIPVEELCFPEHYTQENAARARIRLKNRSLERAAGLLEQCERLGISLISCDSEQYPQALTELSNMPLLLYLRGKLPDSRRNLFTTVVGTRRMTDYGRRMAYSLGAGLAFGGSVVVSGMALGTDSMALVGALDAGGATVAVLGSGVDVIYPREHKELYYKIIDHGAVISEYPPGTPPTGSHFPVRNRIMSGISSGTVVVEAGESSGSLITARQAISQGRKLFAVPGKIGEETAAGPNALLQDGAFAAVCAEDILSEFEFLYPDTLHLENTHTRMRKLDLETLSLNAMNRTRISTGTGGRNYYGSGSYGGRTRDLAKNGIKPPDKAEAPIPPTAERQSAPIPESEEAHAEQTPAPKKSGVRDVISSVFPPKKGNKFGKTEKQTVNSDEKVIPAVKIELDMLAEKEIKVYNKMKPNVPTLPDELVDGENAVSDILSALTMLEMAGAVESGGGGYFVRPTPDDIMQSQND